MNGQLRTDVHCKSKNGRVQIIYVKFNDNNKAPRRNQYAITSQSVPTERIDIKFSLHKRNKNSSVLIHRTPSMSSYASTVHKEHGLTLDGAVISFDLRKRRKFYPGQMYVKINGVKAIEAMLFTGQNNYKTFAYNEKVSDE